MDDVLILRLDLDEDPRVQRLAAVFSCETDLVVAKLWKLWRHAVRFGKDGFLASVWLPGVDAIVGVVGFGHALVQVGWLEQRTDGVQIPRWKEWCSPDAVRRLLSRAEDGPGDQPFFDVFWRAYPRKEGKVAARKAWNRLRPSGDLLKAVLQGVARWAASEQWNKGVIPHASTWLNNWRWEDEIHDGRGAVGQPGRVGAPEGKYDHLREAAPEPPPETEAG